METYLIKLNNTLNKKQIVYSEIQFICDKSGRWKQQFTKIMKCEDKYDYSVTSTSNQLSSLFSKIIKYNNDKLYY